MSRVYVFWTEHRVKDTRQWKWSELRRGRLRQGWGGPGTQLVEDGRAVPFDTWSQRFAAWIKQWEQPELGRQEMLGKRQARFDILCRMLNLKRDDLLIIPHMPSDEEITLAVVTTGYRWDGYPDDTPLVHGQPDFGHVVEVDASQLVTVRRDSSVESRRLAQELKHRRSAVTPVSENAVEYKCTAWRLFRGEDIHYVSG